MEVYKLKDNKKMLLYHFSNYNFKILKTSFFGKNSYSRNEREACQIKRSFLYNSKIPCEYTLKGSNFRYTVSVKYNLIYSLDKDNEGLKVKFNYDIDKILSYLKKKNFLGITYNTSFQCYSLLKDIKVIKQDKLIKEV